MCLDKRNPSPGGTGFKRNQIILHEKERKKIVLRQKKQLGYSKRRGTSIVPSNKVTIQYKA